MICYMTKKFQNKYRIESTRLRSWNYGWNASYFVTICTRNREPFFGSISDSKMYLCDIGVIAEKMLEANPKSFSIC